MLKEILIYPILVIQLILSGPFLFAANSLAPGGIPIKQRLLDEKLVLEATDKDQSGAFTKYKSPYLRPEYVQFPQNETEKELAKNYREAERVLNEKPPKAKEMSLAIIAPKKEQKQTKKSTFKISEEEIWQARKDARETQERLGPISKRALILRESMSDWANNLKQEALNYVDRKNPLSDTEAIEFKSEKSDIAFQMLRTPRNLMVLLGPKAQKAIMEDFQRNFTPSQGFSLDNKYLNECLKQWMASFFRVARNTLPRKVYNTSYVIISEIAKESTKAAKKAIVAANPSLQKFGSKAKKVSNATIYKSVKFMKTWTVETLFFNSAASAAGWIQAGFDASYNPLHFQQWQDGLSDPAGHIGFGAFIAANHGYQAMLRKLPPSMARNLLSPFGMGVGMSASHLVSTILHHPAWKAWMAAPINSEDPTEAKQALILREDAMEVLYFEITSSRFWRSQIDDVAALLSASWIANGALGATKLVAKGMGAILRGANSSAMASSAKYAKTLNNIKSTRVVVSLLDAKQAGTFLVPGALLFKLTHFTVFLLADPLARPVIEKVTKHVEIGSAQTDIKDVLKYSSEYKKFLDEKVIFNRNTESISSVGKIQAEAKPSSPSRVEYGDYNEYSYKKRTAHFPELNRIYERIASFFDSKKEHRTLVSSAVDTLRASWKDYMNAFKAEEEMSKEVYSSFMSYLSDRINKKTDEKTLDFNKSLGKQLVEDDIRNDFIPNFFYQFPEDSRTLVRNNINHLAIASDKIGKQNLNAIQASLIENFRENPKVKWSRSLLGSKPTLNMALFINTALERPIMGMLFGPDANSENPFDLDTGEYPKFKSPKLISSDLNFDINTMAQIPFSKVDGVVRVDDLTANVRQVLGNKYFDEQDRRYKNILQFVVDNMNPDLLPGQANTMDFEDWYEFNVNCRPENISYDQFKNWLAAREKAFANKQSIPDLNPECGSSSISAAYDKYAKIYHDFVLNEVAQIYTDTDGHQSESGTNYLVRKFLGFKDRFWSVDGDNRLSLLDEFYKMANVSVGQLNPIYSTLEDILVSGEFLKNLFIKGKFKAETELSNGIPIDTPDKTAGLGEEDLKLINDIDSKTAELVLKAINVISAKDAAKSLKNAEGFQAVLDELEKTINLYTCKVLQKKDTSKLIILPIDGVGNIKFQHETLWNPQVKGYELILTQLESADFCRDDQVRKKHDFFNATPAKTKLDDGDETYKLEDPYNIDYQLLSQFSIENLTKELKNPDDVLIYLMSEVSLEAKEKMKNGKNLESLRGDYDFVKEIEAALQLTKKGESAGASYSPIPMIKLSDEVNNRIIQAIPAILNNPEEYHQVYFYPRNKEGKNQQMSARTAYASLILGRLSKIMSEEIYPVQQVNLMEYLNILRSDQAKELESLSYNERKEEAAKPFSVPILDHLCGLSKIMSKRLVSEYNELFMNSANKKYDDTVAVLTEPHSYTPEEVTEAEAYAKELLKTPENEALDLYEFTNDSEQIVKTLTMGLMDDLFPGGYCKDLQ